MKSSHLTGSRPMIIPEVRDAYQSAKIWTVFCFLMLGGFVFSQKNSYMEVDALGIWVLTCLIMLYLSRKKPDRFSDNQQRMVLLMGMLMCIFSFVSIPLGFTNPPYYIGELSLLLAGIGVLVFWLLHFRSLVLPVSIPFIAVVGFALS